MASSSSSKAISPSASKATRTPTAGWTPEEVSKMNKYLIKEASGDVISQGKWENAFRRHSMGSISAKKRYQLEQLQKAGTLTAPSPKSSSKEKSSTRQQRDLFNAMFSGSSFPMVPTGPSPLVQGLFFFILNNLELI